MAVQPITIGNEGDVLVEVLADEPVYWTVRYGVEPVEIPFHVRPSDAKKLLDAHGPLTLTIPHRGDRGGVFRHLWALRELAGDNPHRARVLIADRRWRWPYHKLRRYYNVRRQTGFFRIAARNVPELERVSEKFDYARYSLAEDGSRWTPRMALADLLTDIRDWEASQGGNRFDIFFEDELKESSFEDFIELSDAPSVLQAMLRYLPGADIRVDPDGSVAVVNRTAPGSGAGGAAQDVMDDLGYEIVHGGHAKVIVHDNEAPREVHVWFQSKIGVRLDRVENDPDNPQTDDPEEAERRLYPVLPLPDYTRVLNDFVEVQGTIVDWDDYIDFLPSLPGGGRITDDKIRVAMMPGCDLWSVFQEAGVDVTDADWTARISAIREFKDRMYRIARQWNDVMFNWETDDLGTVNQSNGERGPARVYSDWSFIPAMKSIRRQGAFGASLIPYFSNVDGWQRLLNADARPAPCEVVIRLMGQGVILLNYSIDPYANIETILPRQVDLGNFPAFWVGKPGGVPGFSGASRALTFDSVIHPAAPMPRLRQRHRVSVILTGTLAGHGREGGLYRVVVKPENIAGMVEERVLQSASRAKGPVLNLIYPAAQEFARIPWRDDRALDIERFAGIKAGDPDLTGLCVNASRGVDAGIDRGPGGATAGASLDEISAALAAQVWASYADHPIGHKSSDMKGGVVPRGHTDAITHAVFPKTAMRVTMGWWPDRLPRLPMEATLSRGTRAVLLREVYRK